MKNHLEDSGFAIVELLKEQEVAYLNELCSRYLTGQGSDFISSSHFLNKEDSDFINSELHRIIQPAFSNLFPGLQLLGGTLATKLKGTANLEAHQDWSIVDESQFHSYNLWIPLVDTNSENGTLGMIPGSHLWLKNLRGQNIPNPFEKFTLKLLEIGYEPELKAGQAILYDHRLLHYSRPNKTDQKRNTAILGAKDKEAALLVSFLEDGKNISTYEVDEAAFYRFDPVAVKSSYTQTATVNYHSPNLKWADLCDLYTNHVSPGFRRPVSKNNSWLRKMINKFIS